MSGRAAHNPLGNVCYYPGEPQLCGCDHVIHHSAFFIFRITDAWRSKTRPSGRQLVIYDLFECDADVINDCCPITHFRLPK
jgi:hypothetical protein